MTDPNHMCSTTTAHISPTNPHLLLQDSSPTSLLAPLPPHTDANNLVTLHPLLHPVTPDTSAPGVPGLDLARGGMAR
jgi:hypothetical protein